jgi:oligoribonuclease NrnB/cAMP/cGMP phosphodiesterase (DHH superfamily)
MLAVGNTITDFTKSRSAGTIIIADMGPNIESYQPVLAALRLSKSAGWHTFWVDHHVWPKGLAEEIGEVCETVLFTESTGSTKKCTAELCAERFVPANQLASSLARIAHRTDFPDAEKFPIPPLTALIAYYVGFQHLRNRLENVILENVTKGILWDTKMQDDVIEASRLIDSSIQRSIEIMQTKEVKTSTNKKLVIAIAKSESFVSRSMLLGRVMDENDIDLAFAYTDDGKLSIRRKVTGPSKREDLDCSLVARHFREGGGHAGAAGGFLKSRPDQSEEGDSLAVTEITYAVQKYLDGII